MEKLNDLRDLLKHEIQDLYSVEEQIIAAMPNMIAKASNAELKRSLEEHLRVTEAQKARLDQVQQAFGDTSQSEEGQGLLSRLFKTKMVCKGMQGIISEGNQILSANMNPDVMDAAIIACAQKIEHYEICGYGTAKAFARELGLSEVERLLDQSLNEEYTADDTLTALAVGRLNREAENAGNSNGASKGEGNRTSRPTAASGGNTRSSSQRVPQEEMELEMASASKSRTASRGTAAPAKGTAAPKGSAGGRTATGGNAPSASKTAGARGTASKSATSGSSTGKSITGSRTSNTGSSKSGSSSTGRSGSSSRTR